MTNAGIECFLAICRHKTGSAAAESLYITQSSLSTRLKTLEQTLGGQLFFRGRGSREMSLTPIGKAFYPLALEYESLMQRMAEVCVRQTGALRISALNSLSTYLLPTVYDLFLSQNPGLELELQDRKLPEVGRSILEGNTDFALTAGTSTDRYLLQTPLFDEPMVLIASPELELPDTVTPDTLPIDKEVYIDWNSHYSAWHKELFAPRTPKLRISMMSQLQQFLHREACWAIVPVSVAKGLEKDVSLCYLKPDFSLPCRQISLLCSSDTRKDPRMQCFLSCLQDVLKIFPEIKPAALQQ